MKSKIETALEWVDRRSYVFLLSGMVLILLSSPLADSPGAGLLIVQLGFTVFVAVALFLSRAERGYLILTSVAVVVWLATAWSGSGGVNGELGLLSAAMLILICCSVFLVVEGAVLKAPVVDANVLCGGIACYFLLALIWALSFIIVEISAPGAIQRPHDAPLTWSDMVYFSLTCLTTLGFGDILAVDPFLRIWVAMETVAGVVYLAVFVARLVSLYQVHKPTD